MKNKVVLKWSKKRKDWEVNHPEWPSRNADIIGDALFEMIARFEKFMSTNWEGKPTGFTNLRDYLERGGFDPDTFTISVKGPTEENKNI